jgi:hypothetical protein
VLGVPGAGVVAGVERRDPGRLQPLGRHPPGRDEPQDAPPVGLAELVEDLLGGRATVEDLRHHVGWAGDVRHHQHVALEPRDRGDAVAEDVDHAVRDLLQDLLGVGGGVDAAHQLRQPAQRALLARHAHLPNRGPRTLHPPEGL